MPKPSHPQAVRARHEAEQARKVAPHSGLILHLANELRDAADAIDEQYHQANFFIPKPRFLQGRRRANA